MNISRYHYPHPILGKEEDFPDGLIDVSFSVEKKDAIFSITYILEFNDNTIKELIKSGSAELICEVTCSSTFFRKCFFSNDCAFEGIEFTIDEKYLRGNVEFIFLIVAKNDIPNYLPGSDNGVFTQRTYWIQKGELLGFLGSYRKNIDIKVENLSDYIKIVESEIVESLQYDYNENFIKVVIPKEYFKKAEYLSNGETFRNILISTHIAPAIQNALFHFVNRNEDDFRHNEKTWYKFLKLQVTEFTDSDESSLEHENVVGLTERILNDHSIKIIEILDEFIHQYEEKNIDE